MMRKWTTLAVSLSFGLGLGLSAAAFSGVDGKEDPIVEIMEKVNKPKAVLTKGTRNASAFAKAREDIKKATEVYIELAKETKKHNEAAKAAKNVPDAEKKWDELCDAWEKETKKLAEIVDKADSTQKEAKDQHNTINKTCTECHKVFRIESDDF